MKNEDKHQKVLENLYNEYYLAKVVDDKTEFIWDGPSHWDKYEDKSKPRIVFLTKESHSSFHPSTPSNVDNTFSRNIARWTNIITSALDINSKIKNPYSDELQEAWNSIAIVEIKKTDTGQTISPKSIIKKFAKIGREFLKLQLEILDPHIIVCCATIESYDIINNYSEEEKKENEKLIYNESNIMAWNCKDVIVVDFCHPSNRVSHEKMFESMKDVITNPFVQSEYFKIRKSK